MKISFTYDREKDVWCLLNKGKGSNNSETPTKQYKLLVETYGASPTTEETTIFIDTYLAENKIDILKCLADFQSDWSAISSEFQKKSEVIFGTTLPNDITAYLTINSRCPYNIKEDFFYVSPQSAQLRKTVMHELWHFYTWYGLGPDQEEKLGEKKYNDLKEALTVLLNIECGGLLPQGVVDAGYPQHQEIRERILEYWQKDRNIKNLWISLK